MHASHIMDHVARVHCRTEASILYSWEQKMFNNFFLRHIKWIRMNLHYMGCPCPQMSRMWFQVSKMQATRLHLRLDGSVDFQFGGTRVVSEMSKDFHGVMISDDYLKFSAFDMSQKARAPTTTE